jgi:hypothetical protein
MSLQAVSRADWFSPARSVTVPRNATLADIVALAEVPRWIVECGEVAIDGHIVPRRYWRLVRPKDGTIVTVYPPTLHGGDRGGTKQVLTIVATIALIAGTAFIGAGALAPLVGAWAGSAWGSSVLAGAFGLAGQLALRALAPPPVAANNRSRNFKPETVAGITGNPIQPFEYLPKVMGNFTVSPPFVMQPYSLLEDGVVTVYAIVGLAGYTAINRVMINGVDIDEFPDVDYQTREGGSGSSTALTLVTRSGVEAQGEAISDFDLVEANGELWLLVDQSTPENSYSLYHQFQTVGAVDEAILRLAFPAGFYYQASGGERRAGIPFRIEFKLSTSSTWIKGPEFHISPLDNFSKPLRQHVKIVFGAISGSAVPSSSEATFYAYGYTGNQSYNWQANSHFRQTGTLKPAKNVKIDRDGIEIYLSGSTFPAGKYDIRIRRGIGYTYDFFTASSYSYDGNTNRAIFFDKYFSGSGTWIVRWGQQGIVGTVQVETFTCIKDTHPIGNTTDLCLIAVKARKTKIDSIAAEFTSRARTFDGVSWGSTYEATDNPAALYREVLLGSLNAQPLASTLVDDQELGLAYLDATSNGYVANGVIQGYSVEQALQEIAATCRGVPRQEEKWSILLERDTSSESPVQVLSSRIIRNLTVQRSFDKIPHAIRAEYMDEDEDFRPREIIVYRDGYNSSNATLFQAIRYNLYTDAAKVTARAEFDLAQMIYRKNTYTFEMDWAHLVSPRGSLVALAVDELDSTAASAVITEVLASGGNITGLRLDAPVTTPGSGAGVTIQLDTGGTLTKEITSVTDSQTLTFSTPFADPGTIEIGKIVAVGAFVSTSRRCKVFEIERLGDLEARVTLLDEAPEIHA